MQTRFDLAALGWRVLLIGGASGVGKSTIALRLRQRCSIPWLQVDDLRLVQRVWYFSGVSPYDFPALSPRILPRYSKRTVLALIRSGLPFPDADAVPTFDGQGGLLSHGELLSPAIEVVIENHIDQGNPAILEGDAILPAIFERDPVRHNADSGWLRAVFLYEPEERAIQENMQMRGGTLSDTAHAHKNWQYSEWLRREAESRGLPTLPVRPWDTLENRILHAVGTRLVTRDRVIAGFRP